MEGNANAKTINMDVLSSDVLPSSERSQSSVNKFYGAELYTNAHQPLFN